MMTMVMVVVVLRVGGNNGPGKDRQGEHCKQQITYLH